jgi:hypothetical protein
MGIGVERPIFKSNYSHPQTSSSRLTAFRTHVVFTQTQYKKRNAQNLYYEADVVLELLHSRVRPYCWNPEAKRL